MNRLLPLLSSFFVAPTLLAQTATPYDAASPGDAAAGAAAGLAALGCGIYVAQGRSIGAKEETTIAVTPAAFRAANGARHKFLSFDWISRWNRSHAKFPAGLLPGQQPVFEQMIRQHEQFQNG